MANTTNRHVISEVLYMKDSKEITGRLIEHFPQGVLVHTEWKNTFIPYSSIDRIETRFGAAEDEME